MNATLPASTQPGLRRLSLLVFLGVLLLAIPQAALMPLLDRDEPRFAEASREMRESGNFIVPTFNHAPRYAKPPLIYWCQAVSFTAFGENAFAARLPSLLATAGTALLLFLWGTQLGSKSIGLIAAFSYAFCLQTVQQGRVATADALLIFFMTLTGFAGWKFLLLYRQHYEKTEPSISHQQSLFLWALLLVVGFAGGFLAKGPEALLPFLALLICARETGRWLSLKLTICFLLGLVLIMLWAMPAYIQTHGAYWREGLSEGIGQRMVTGMQGHGASSAMGYLATLPYYLLLFWISALPWSPLLLWQRRKLFVGTKPDGTDSYLFISALIIFLVFSFMVTKLPHYTLPAFPFIALFFARRWMATGLSPSLPLKLTVGFGVGFALFAMVSIPTALARNDSPSPVGVLVREAQAAGALNPETKFAVVDFQEPNVVWEARQFTSGSVKTIPASDVLAYLNGPGPRAVVLSSKLWRNSFLPTDDTSPEAPLDKEVGKDVSRVLDEARSSYLSFKTYEAKGFNAAKGSFIDLTLVVKK